MPPEERPRQRLLRSDGECLSHAEVLALVLGNGCREVCSLELAREILDEAGTLDGLVGVQPEALLRRGLGEAKEASVLAALELARRLVQVQVPERAPMERPERVVPYLVLRYALRDQEVMGALYLDTRKRLVGERDVFRGTLSKASVEPPPDGRGLPRPRRRAGGLPDPRRHPTVGVATGAGGLVMTADRQEERRGRCFSREVNGVHLKRSARGRARPLDSRRAGRGARDRPEMAGGCSVRSFASATSGRAPWNLPPKGAAMNADKAHLDPSQTRDELLLLNQVQAAKFLTVNPRTMEGWRYKGE